MVDELLKKFPIISDQIELQELRVILRELEHVTSQGVVGDVVELGCYTGTTSLFIQRLLNAVSPERAFHVYDSFAGLPDKTAADQSPAGEQFQGGELHASKRRFIQHFNQANLPLPFIHKAWFHDLTPADMPVVAFAFLDGDFYQSIKESLRLIEDQLASGAVIVVDDYQSEALPGAAKAVDEWMTIHPGKLRVESSLAIITNQ